MFLLFGQKLSVLVLLVLKKRCRQEHEDCKSQEKNANGKVCIALFSMFTAAIYGE